MLVSDRPAWQTTLVAFVIVKAERTAAIARMKRILLVEKVGREGWLRRLVEKVSRKALSKRLVEKLVEKVG